MISSQSVRWMSVGDFAAAAASDAPVPGGGGVSATIAAFAAALAGMAGRYALRNTAEPGPFRGLLERADALRSDALLLADDDAAAYGGYVEASWLPREPDPDVRRRAVRAALDAAADVPCKLAALAAEIAAGGEELAASGNPNLRSDACAATLLASPAAASAAVLVGENLRARPDDPRVAEAARCAAQASAAAGVLDSFGYVREAGS